MSAVILPRVLRFKATFNSIYKCEKASWDKEILFDFRFCYITYSIQTPQLLTILN